MFTIIALSVFGAGHGPWPPLLSFHSCSADPPYCIWQSPQSWRTLPLYQFMSQLLPANPYQSGILSEKATPFLLFSGYVSLIGVKMCQDRFEYSAAVSALSGGHVYQSAARPP